MSKAIHIQQTLAAPTDVVYRALTEAAALETWFAEHAFVSVEEGRFDFWGRFTPETPSASEGHHHIQLMEQDRRVRFTWPLRGADTTVDIRLTARGGKTVLGVWHHDVPGIPMGQPDCYSMGDLWFLWLENLRRYLAGRAVARSDFSTSREGNLALTLDIDGAPADVWDALTQPEQRNRWIAADASAEAAVGEAWIDWGEGVGPLQILSLEPQKELSLGWEIEGTPTIVTWTLEETGGKTRLTLAHSGFAETRRSDGEWAGWLTYLTMIKSLVEVGIEWLPPVKEITKEVALYYAATVWARQDEVLGEDDEEWG